MSIYSILAQFMLATSLRSRRKVTIGPLSCCWNSQLHFAYGIPVCKLLHSTPDVTHLQDLSSFLHLAHQCHKVRLIAAISPLPEGQALQETIHKLTTSLDCLGQHSCLVLVHFGERNELGESRATRQQLGDEVRDLNIISRNFYVE